MSGLLMGKVYSVELTHAQQAIMLALADHGADNGTRIFPSIELIAWKTGYSERQVQRLMRELETMGVIVPVAHVTGGRGHATEYVMSLSRGKQKPPAPEVRSVLGENVTVSPAVKGDISNTKGDISNTKGDISSKTCVRPNAPRAASEAASRDEPLLMNRHYNHHINQERERVRVSTDPAIRSLSLFNDLWDTAKDVLGEEPTVEGTRREWRDAIQTLIKAGATPDELRRRADRYVTLYERKRLTLPALVKHWDKFATEASNGESTRKHAALEAARQAERDRIAAIKRDLYRDF